MAEEAPSRFVPETGSQSRGRLNERVSQEALSASASASIFRELTGLHVEATSSLGVTRQTVADANSSTSLSGTNIGYQMLRKAGWKEGTGLGATEQGRLNPVDAPYKSDRSGIGAAKRDNVRIRKAASEEVQDVGKKETKKSKKETRSSKRAKKREAEEQRLQEHAFERAFYREFWPENV